MLRIAAVSTLAILLVGCSSEPKCCDANNTCTCSVADGGFVTMTFQPQAIMVDCQTAQKACLPVADLQGMALDAGCRTPPSCSCSVFDPGRCD